MKKALLGTTALIAGGLIAGSVMAADLEPAPLPAPVDEGFEVTVSGTAFGGFFYQDSNRIGDAKDMLVPWLSEIWFTATTTLANGIQVGVRVELEGVTVADQIDEHYIWLQGNFGKFVIGADDGASDVLAIGGPGYGALGVDGPSFVSVTAVGVATSRRKDFDGDANKVSYFTPRISGFQAGVSFTPNNNGTGGSQAQFRTAGAQSNIFAAAANYKNTFNDVSIAFGAGYQTGKTDWGGARRSVWNAGAKVGFGGFSIGGNYGVDNRGAGASDKVWVVSASYGTGPWAVGAGFLQGKRAGVKYRRVGGGATYSLGTGVTLTADVNFEKQSNSGVWNGKGVLAGVGIATAF